MTLYRTALCTIALASCALVNGCDFVGGGPTVVGSGKTAQETRTVDHFDSIAVSGSGRLLFRQGDQDSLKIEADDNLLPLITSKVEGGELHLGIRNNTSVSTHSPIVYTVTARELMAVQLSGSLTAKIDSLDAERFDVHISGTGDVVVSGRARHQSIDISGTGTFDGSACPGTTGDVHISGSGHVVINVAEHLDANVSGSGNIEYIGHPSLNTHVSGSGHVSNRACILKRVGLVRK